MSKVIHIHAHRAAHTFFELMWDELPDTWLDDITAYQFEFELWLATFDVKRTEEGWRNFALLTEVRRRAETYYQRDLKLAHHNPPIWAFFRFRLELALLQTVQANQSQILHCYAWHDITGALAARLHFDQERPMYPRDDPRRENPF